MHFIHKDCAITNINNMDRLNTSLNTRNNNSGGLLSRMRRDSSNSGTPRSTTSLPLIDIFKCPIQNCPNTQIPIKRDWQKNPIFPFNKEIFLKEEEIYSVYISMPILQLLVLKNYTL
uniref:Uncharacterized protein n=2 Tax=Meloidogyne TaxID=189290 RepID=A0A914LHT2_MELIC